MSMHILLAGATGFVGRALVKRLFLDGHTLTVVTRDAAHLRHALNLPIRAVTWDQLKQTPQEICGGVDSVISLAGESIAQRWTPRAKAKIVSSRLDAIDTLLRAFESVSNPQLKTFIIASAVGFYGDRGGEVLDENSGKGQGFLSDVCAQSEEALAQCCLPHVRTVFARFGIVLGHGGLLARIQLLFQLGLGAKLGSGEQWMSWIHIDDLVRAMLLLLEDDSIRGPVNLVSPHPVQNKEFTRVLATSVHKVALFRVPYWFLRCVFGHMAELFLGSQRVVPHTLIAAGFVFHQPKIDIALTHLCEHAFGPYVQSFQTYQYLPASPQTLFLFHCTEENLNTITPDWLMFRVTHKSTPVMQRGAVIEYALTIHHVPLRWRTLIEEYHPPHSFIDTQTAGPFSVWHHTHLFQPVLGGGTVKEEYVRYRAPGGWLGLICSYHYLRWDIARIFQTRADRTLTFFAQTESINPD